MYTFNQNLYIKSIKRKIVKSTLELWIKNQCEKMVLNGSVNYKPYHDSTKNNNNTSRRKNQILTIMNNVKVCEQWNTFKSKYLSIVLRIARTRTMKDLG